MTLALPITPMKCRLPLHRNKISCLRKSFHFFRPNCRNLQCHWARGPFESGGGQVRAPRSLTGYGPASCGRRTFTLSTSSLMLTSWKRERGQLISRKRAQKILRIRSMHCIDRLRVPGQVKSTFVRGTNGSGSTADRLEGIECHVSFNHRQGLTTRLNTLTDSNPSTDG